MDRRYWSRSASRVEAAARGGGSRAGRLHGASGACLSSAGSGRRRPDRAARLFLTMGDVLSTHLDDARRQHIAGESDAAQRARGSGGEPRPRPHPGLPAGVCGETGPRQGGSGPGPRPVVQACFSYVWVPLPGSF